MAQHSRLQPGEPVAAVGSARRNRGLVSDQSVVTVYQDRRAVGEACAVLLADAGGRAPDASAVCCDDATDRAVAPSGKLTMIARAVIRVAEDKGGGKSV